MCADFIGKNKEKSNRKNAWGQKVKKCRKCQYLEFIGRDDYPYCYEMFRLGWGIRKIPDIDSIPNLCPRPNKFRRSVEELKEFIKKNNIKLLEILKYIRRRNDKKIQKETIDVKNNS